MKDKDDTFVARRRYVSNLDKPGDSDTEKGVYICVSFEAYATLFIFTAILSNRSSARLVYILLQAIIMCLPLVVSHPEELPLRLLYQQMLLTLMRMMVCLQCKVTSTYSPVSVALEVVSSL